MEQREEGKNALEAALAAGYTRFRPVIMTALAKDPNDRFPTIDDFAAAIAVEDTSEYIARTEKNKAQVKALAKSLETKDKQAPGTTAKLPAVKAGRKAGTPGRAGAGG